MCLRPESNGKTPLFLLPFACEVFQAFCENRLPEVWYGELEGGTCPQRLLSSSWKGKITVLPPLGSGDEQGAELQSSLIMVSRGITVFQSFPW